MMERKRHLEGSVVGLMHKDEDWFFTVKNTWEIRTHA